MYILSRQQYFRSLGPELGNSIKGSSKLMHPIVPIYFCYDYWHIGIERWKVYERVDPSISSLENSIYIEEINYFNMMDKNLENVT